MEFGNNFAPFFYGAKPTEQSAPPTDGTGRHSSYNEENQQSQLDLNAELISNRAATFFLRVHGEAMTGAGIHEGDLIIVDRSLRPQSGKIVIASLNGDMLIRRFEKTFNKMRLLPETPRLAPIDIDPSCEDFSIWGVVVYVIHRV